MRFQEVEKGNLIVLVRNVLEKLNHKFLIRPVEFEGIYRIEKHEYPAPAIREMLLNALIHRTYMGAFIQIRVYDDKISIWNDGMLPEGMSLEKLKLPHSSKPRNLEEALQKMDLNERQIGVVLYVKEMGEITTSEYAKRYNIAERTTRKDLNELIDKQIFKRIGEKKNAKYVFC